MNSPKVKICGITNIIDAKTALHLNADYIGLNNIKSSPRYLDKKEIKEIINGLSKEEHKKVVLLTESDDIEEIDAFCDEMQINIIQPYSGRLSFSDYTALKELGFEIFKPFRVSVLGDIKRLEDYHELVDLIILDTKSEKALGGTGETFNWDIFSKAKEKCKTKLGLAGGLNLENISGAIAKTEPYLVDVSSGLESRPRIKSLDMMRRFFETIEG